MNLNQWTTYKAFLVTLTLASVVAALTPVERLAASTFTPSHIPVSEHRRPVHLRPDGKSVGDLLPRIITPLNYQAVIHAIGLASPDGLAWSLDGSLYVAEESAGRISKVAPNGVVTVYAAGISSPEGIVSDESGNVYVVEDIQNGRVIRINPDGSLSVLATGRDAPEGVDLLSNGLPVLTESTVQFAGSPFEYQTKVTRLDAGGNPSTINSAAWFWSYSGITHDWSGMLFVANEASSVGTTDSIFRINPDTGARTLFCSGLTACEGLRFRPGGLFPLYVVEEDLGSGEGRLSQVSATGIVTTFATGFYNIEDVILDTEGRFYVSEDTSGYIIRIEPIPSPPAIPATSPTSVAGCLLLTTLLLLLRTKGTS